MKELNSSGKVLVSAKHPETNVLKQAEFTISGGECTCHIEKIVGTDEIRFYRLIQRNQSLHKI